MSNEAKKEVGRVIDLRVPRTDRIIDRNKFIIWVKWHNGITTPECSNSRYLSIS